MSRTSCILAAFPALLVGLLLAAPAAQANGILVAGSPDASPSTGGRRGPVRLEGHDVRAALRDRIAEVRVEQVFHNDSRRRLEGTYLFPLPRGAAVSEFAMTMGGKMVQGEVLEAEQARRIYRSIVHRRRDPGLLEYVGRGLYRARVFPIEPQSDLTIRLKYQQVLPEDAGVLEMRYPLATDRLNGEPVESVRIDVAIESSVDLKAVYSPSHRLDLAREGERKARVTYESRGHRQSKDFLLYLGRSPDDVGFSMLSHKPAGEDGTFMAVLAPRVEVEDGERIPKDVVYVLDTSGSMASKKLRQAKAALTYGVRMLRNGDRFNIVAFSSSTRLFRDSLVPSEAATTKAAAAWIDKLESRGGTNIEQALRDALAMHSDHRLFLVVFLTDGVPTVGERNTVELLHKVKRANTAKARIFTFGVGHDLNVGLLDRIAGQTRGAREYIAPEEDIEIATGRLFRKVDRPVMSDVRVDLGPGVYDVYPQELPDLFGGEQVVIYGRYKEGGPRTVLLKGRLGRREVAHEHAATLAAGEDAEFLPRLWAHRKVAFLLDAIRLNGADKELTDEVVRLATRFAIVTPYTAGLVVEERELGRVRSENPLFQIGGRSLSNRSWRGPSGSVPPHMREPTDPTPPPPPPPTGAPTTPPPTTPGTPTPATPSVPAPGGPAAPTVPTPAAGGKAHTAASKDLRKRKEAENEVDDEDLRTIRDRVRTVAGKTFTLRKDGRWVDTDWDGKQETVEVEAFSPGWLELLEKDDRIGRWFALGERVVFVFGETAYEVVRAK